MLWKSFGREFLFTRTRFRSQLSVAVETKLEINHFGMTLCLLTIKLTYYSITYDTGISSNAHFGRNGIEIDFKPTNNVGLNNSSPASKNSLFTSLLKQPGSMPNKDFITFSVVYLVQI